MIYGFISQVSVFVHRSLGDFHNATLFNYISTCSTLVDTVHLDGETAQAGEVNTDTLGCSCSLPAGVFPSHCLQLLAQWGRLIIGDFTLIL